MSKRIINRKTIYIVVEQVDDGGWILSNNRKAFLDKEAADYYANGLNNKNTDGDTYYNVEPLEMLETS